MGQGPIIKIIGPYRAPYWAFVSYFGPYFPFVGCPIFPFWAALFSLWGAMSRNSLCMVAPLHVGSSISACPSEPLTSHPPNPFSPAHPTPPPGPHKNNFCPNKNTGPWAPGPYKNDFRPNKNKGPHGPWSPQKSFSPQQKYGPLGPWFLQKYRAL